MFTACAALLVILIRAPSVDRLLKLEKSWMKAARSPSQPLTHKMLETLGSIQFELHKRKRGGAATFKDVISPVSPVDFLHTAYQRRVLHINGTNPLRFSQLFGLSTVEPYLAFQLKYHNGSLYAYERFGFVEIWQDGHRVRPLEQNLPLEQVLGSVKKQMNEGCSFVLNGAHNAHATTFGLTHNFQQAFQLPAQCNIYVTKPPKQPKTKGDKKKKKKKARTKRKKKRQSMAPSVHAKPVHCDDHAVFVLQVEGRKEWTIWDPPAPLAFHRHVAACSGAGAADTLTGRRTVVVAAGDVLYMPQGTPHRAQTVPGDAAASVHLNVGLFSEHLAGGGASAGTGRAAAVSSSDTSGRAAAAGMAAVMAAVQLGHAKLVLQLSLCVLVQSPARPGADFRATFVGAAAAAEGGRGGAGRAGGAGGEDGSDSAEGERLGQFRLLAQALVARASEAIAEAAAAAAAGDSGGDGGNGVIGAQTAAGAAEGGAPTA